MSSQFSGTYFFKNHILLPYLTGATIDLVINIQDIRKDFKTGSILKRRRKIVHALRRATIFGKDVVTDSLEIRKSYHRF